MPYVSLGKQNSGSIETHCLDRASGQPVVLIQRYGSACRQVEVGNV